MFIVLLLTPCACGEVPGDAQPSAPPANAFNVPPTIRYPDPAANQLVPVKEADPYAELIARQMANVRDLHKNAPQIGIVFGPALEIKGKALAALFPDKRFFILQWDQVVKTPPPPGTPPPLGLGLGIHQTIAIAGDSSVRALGFDRTCADFAEFLAANGVRISNQREAQLVRDAFCEIRRERRKGEVVKAADGVWKMGGRRVDFGRGQFGELYLEIKVNHDYSVRSGQMKLKKPDGTVVDG